MIAAGNGKRGRIMVKAFPLVALPLLVAAAPVSDPGLAALAAEDARVATVAWRLQTAGIGLCRDEARLAGFTVHSLGQYAPGDRARVADAYRIDARPAVLAVVPGSAAAKAGLRAGDVLASIGGKATAATLPRGASYAVTAWAEDAIEGALARGALSLVVSRSGAARQAVVAGDKGCSSRVQIVAGTVLGAQADGRYVQITGAGVAFAASDAALAALIAHELAHNFLKHRARLDAEGVSRGVFAGLGKSGARFRATEYEADRLSVWIVARGGFSVDAIVPFWTAWAKRRDPGPLSDGTHPGWRDRIARMSAAVAEVKAQRAAGRTLNPTQ
jgi:beta-barrel assembly-enhancing protease